MSLEEQEPMGSAPGEGDRIGELLRLVGPREPIPGERETRVKTAVRAAWLEEIGQRGRRRRRRWTAGTLALAAALLLAAGVLYLNRSLPTAPLPDDVLVGTVQTSSGLPAFAAGRALHEGVRLETGPHGRLALALGGGPSVRLDTETSVSIDSASSLSLEAGAVYVDTGFAGQAGAGGSGRIEVHTAFGVARDVGTRFEVRLGEGSMRLRVREGEVLFDRGGESHSAGAGLELTVDAAGVVDRERVPVHGGSWDWVLETSPLLDLEGASLAEILDWTSRETGWEIRYDGGARDAVRPLLGEVLHGAVPAGARADELIFQVLMTYGLDARLEDGTLWIEPFD